MAVTTHAATKVCRVCGVEKGLADFSPHPTSRLGVRPDCRDCRRVSEQARYRLRPNARNAQRWRTRKHKYGITEEQYLAFLAEQDGACAICRALPGEQSLCVDHDHVTRAVRGLLCQPCNFAIGHMADDPNRLRRAASYLEESR